MAKRRFDKDALGQQLHWDALDQDYLRQLVGLAKIEDLAGAGMEASPARMGDVTSALMPETATGRARLVARESLTVCGLGLLPLVAAAYDTAIKTHYHASDAAQVEAGSVLAELTGPARAILQAERIVLNFIQRLSGVATETRTYADALAGSKTMLLDTRKTTPGYRALEKYAVTCGGGRNHRYGLFDRVMLKDNHLAVAGATGGDRLCAAVRQARETYPDLAIEVEVDAIEQIEPVLAAGADVLLLDNFDTPSLREAIALIGDRAYTEASGGITLARLPELATLGLDFISTGALVHHSVWRDIGLDWEIAKP